MLALQPRHRLGAGPRHAVLRTARLTLRPLTAADVPNILDGVGNYDVSRWLAVVPYPYRRPDAEAFVAEAALQIGRTWGIDDSTGFRGVITTNGGAVGFWISRHAWGRGYVTEAGDAVLDAWFAARRAAPLWASHMAENGRSRHVLEKLGFVDAGPTEVVSVALKQTVPGRRMWIPRERWRARRRHRLSTARVKLRELRDRDLPALLRIAGDPRVAHNRVDVSAPWSEEEARRWLDAHRFRGRIGFCAAIVRRGRFVGGIGLEHAPDGDAPSCSSFLDPRLWSRGLATEATGAFLADAMARFTLPVVSGRCFADDPAGGAVLRKLGFVEVDRQTATSPARLEPAPVVVYRLERSNLKVPS